MDKNRNNALAELTRNIMTEADKFEINSESKMYITDAYLKITDFGSPCCKILRCGVS